MKSKRLVCIIAVLSLLFSAAACRQPAEQEETGEFRASVDMMVEGMALDEKSAIAALEILTSFGLDERIEYIYEAEDEDGNMYYKVWFGLNLLCVYLDGKNVTKVFKYGEQVYPELLYDDNTNGDNSDDDNGDGEGNTDYLPEPLDIEIISLTSPIKAGNVATIEIVGTPDVEYEITVTYSSGPSTAQGLEPKYSNADGFISWTWRVSANVKPGEYSITITSSGASYETTFVVQ